MKVLTVNTYDVSGGAARAANRLHKALLLAGIESQMLVNSKISDDFTILGQTSKIIKSIVKTLPFLDSLPIRLYSKRKALVFSTSWISFGSIVKKINALKPDIVHLHWVCGGLITINEISKIKAPIVWSLHDNWAFSGGCHVAWNCNNYQDSCGTCPGLGSSFPYDLSNINFYRKRKAYSKVKNLTIVGVSSWLSKISSESSLLKNRKILTLPNPLDTDIFKPFDKVISRELMGLPKSKKLILFGANNAINDVNKGLKELIQALNIICIKDIEIVVFGQSKPKGSDIFKFKTHYQGYIYDNISLRLLYSSADVMVVPSLQEAFGQTASEAMSCGIPVVAFETSGLLDIVDHKVNGYLAKKFDPNDLATGIDWVLNTNNYEELSNNARQKVLREFDSKVVSKKYIDLYNNILEENQALQ